MATSRSMRIRSASRGCSPRPLASVLLACALTACTADGPDGEGEGGGTDPGRWTLHEAFRIGSVDDPGTSFTRVRGIARIGDTLLVVERDPARAARFTLDGRWLGDFAREGDGPGELRIPQAIGGAEGRIWISDIFGQRLETYTPGGRHLESFRFQIPGDASGTAAIAGTPLSDGSLLAKPAGSAPSDLIDGTVRNWTYRRATRSGEDLGPLYVAEVYPTDHFIGEVRAGAYIQGWHPLPEMALVEPFPHGSGVVVVERKWEADGEGSPVFRVLVHGPDGGVETDTVLPFDPIPAEDFVEPYLAEREAEMRTSLNYPPERVLAALNAFRAVSPRAHYPPVTDLLPGTDGSIWIRREDTFSDSVAWQVLDRGARVLGTLTTPADLALHLVSRSEAWGVETDELGVE